MRRQMLTTMYKKPIIFRNSKSMFQLASTPRSRPVRYSGAQNMPLYKLKRFVLGDQGLAEL